MTPRRIRSISEGKNCIRSLVTTAYFAYARTAFRLLSAGLLLAVLLAGVAHPANAQRNHPLRDAFLPYQVESTDALIAAIRKEPRLRRLYARHFGVSEARVVDFVRNAIISYRLPAARNVTTYGVTKGGRIYPVQQRLQKGTRVWATRSGLPVLKWACANPLTKTLPGTKVARKPVSSRLRPLTTPPTYTPPEELAVLEFPGDIVPPETEVALLPPPTPVDLTSVVESPESPIPPLAARGGRANFAPFLLPLVFALTSNGGGGGNNQNGGNATVVPEPGTLALWGAAGLPFAVTLRRRRRRK